MDGSDAGRTTDSGPPGGARRIPAEVWDARQAASALIAEAQESARRIRGEATREADGARAAAVQSGFAEGFAAGRAHAAAAVVHGAAERDRLLGGCAEELLLLASEMAERILAREVRPGVDGVAAAERALSLVRDRPRVALRASPDDAAALREGGVLPGYRRLRLIVDPELGAGEVIVEADGATVDGRFRAQLAELRRAIAVGQEC